ncbi:hypothetical protein BDD12DRAFT_805744 [Trichophaea hybrida]|nr:hypothetical protein BDD12DRAFT_805744 [Trichophaea hybrida]
MTETITRLQTELLATWVRLEEALQAGTGRPEGIHIGLGKSIVPDPPSRLQGKPLHHMRMVDKENFYPKKGDADTPMDEGTQCRNIIEWFIEEVREHYSNHTEKLKIMHKYHHCTQGKRDFQTFYQELSMWAIMYRLWNSNTTWVTTVETEKVHEETTCKSTMLQKEPPKKEQHLHHIGESYSQRSHFPQTHGKTSRKRLFSLVT